MPLPYSASRLVPSLDTSSRSLGSLREKSDNFNNLNLRSSTGGSFIPSKRFTSFASLVVASMKSWFACEAIASVSSVMKLACTHAAREDLTDKSSNSFSLSAMNFSASANVGLPFGGAFWKALRDTRSKCENDRNAQDYDEVQMTVCLHRASDVEMVGTILAGPMKSTNSQQPIPANITPLQFRNLLLKLWKS